MTKRRTRDPFGNPIATPRGSPAPLFTVVTCPRCAKPCMIRQTSAPQDTPFISLVPATTTNGLCEECAAHWWLFTIDGLRWAFRDGPGVLALPAVQCQLHWVLARRHPALGALDWRRLLDRWDLPWPEDWRLPTDR